MHGPKRGDIETLARRRSAKMVILYKSWFNDRIPDDWVEVGSWTIPMNKYAADRTITIYATRPDWRDEVASRWRAYVRNAGKPNGGQVDGERPKRFASFSSDSRVPAALSSAAIRR